MFAIFYKTVSNINKVVIKDLCYFPFIVNNNIVCRLLFDCKKQSLQRKAIDLWNLKRCCEEELTNVQNHM